VVLIQSTGTTLPLPLQELTLGLFFSRSGNEDIPIYNFVSSCENPISWGRYIDENIKHSWEVPFEKSVWMVTLTKANVQFLYKIYALFIHLLPALVMDVVLFGLGQKPRYIDL
jgi:fatty acyl-CoA reductase